MKTKIRKEPLEFKVYEKSNLFYEDYQHLLDKYLGKEEKMYWDFLQKKVFARPKRLCDLDYDDVVKLTIAICDLEMELYSQEYFDQYYLKYGRTLIEDIAGHWSDVMADWVSESKGMPVLP